MIIIMYFVICQEKKANFLIFLFCKICKEMLKKNGRLI